MTSRLRGIVWGTVRVNVVVPDSELQPCRMLFYIGTIFSALGDDGCVELRVYFLCAC